MSQTQASKTVSNVNSESGRLYSLLPPKILKANFHLNAPKAPTAVYNGNFGLHLPTSARKVINHIPHLRHSAVLWHTCFDFNLALAKEMNGISAEVVEKNIVRLQNETVFVFLKPVEPMISESSLLPGYDYDHMCFYMSAPKNSCTSGHLGMYLADKFEGVRQEENNTLFTYPFVVYVFPGIGEYSPIPKLFTLEMMQRSWPFCFDATENCFTLYYSHENRIESVVQRAPGPSSPVGAVNMSSPGSSAASAASMDSIKDESTDTAISS